MPFDSLEQYGILNQTRHDLLEMPTVCSVDLFTFVQQIKQLEMTSHEFESKLTQTIECLSDPETYDVVCHEHRLGEPLPSIVNLQKIIDMIREILFPGYFGNTSLASKYHKALYGSIC
jgi:hypothetical protein